MVIVSHPVADDRSKSHCACADASTRY